MFSHGKWIAGLTLGVLVGGCFASYGYNDFDGKGTGGEGTGGGGGEPGSSTNASSSSGGGGGICAVTLCGETQTDCVPSGCASTQWARRFGEATQRQRANGVALATPDRTLIAGTYETAGFTFDGAIVSPSAGSPNNGFLALLDSAGTAIAEIDFPKHEISALAVNTAGAAIVAGHEENGAIHYAFLTKRSVTANSLNELWTSDLGSSMGQTHTVAIATLGTDIYVLGTNTVNDNPTKCPLPDGDGALATIDAGMFVAKFDDNSGNCQWVMSFSGSPGTLNIFPTAIVAKGTNSTPELWITGWFHGQMGMPNGANGMMATSTADMFLISLDGSSLGKPIGQTLSGNMGRIEPNAIDIDNTKAVIVGGMVQGVTPLNSGMNSTNEQKGAFIAQFDPSTFEIKSKTTFLAGNTTDNFAQITGVKVVGDRIYAAGSFAGTMALDASGLAVSNIGVMKTAQTAPFLAVLASTGLQPFQIDVFPSNEMASSTPLVHLDASTDSVALAGGWWKTVDFSTGNANWILTEPKDSMAPDIFVAKFKP